MKVYSIHIIKIELYNAYIAAVENIDKKLNTKK